MCVVILFPIIPLLTWLLCHQLRGACQTSSYAVSAHELLPSNDSANISSVLDSAVNVLEDWDTNKNLDLPGNMEISCPPVSGACAIVKTFIHNAVRCLSPKKKRARTAGRRSSSPIASCMGY
jgi:hypothetical protein